MKIYYLLFCFLAILCSPLTAQELADGAGSVDFREMNRQKRLLEAQIRTITTDLESARATLRNLRSDEELQEEKRYLDESRSSNLSSLASANQALENTKKRLQEITEALPTLQDQSQIARLTQEKTDLDSTQTFQQSDVDYYTEITTTRYQSSLSQLTEEATRRATINSQINNLQSNLAEKEEELINLDNQISDLLNRDNFQNSFRLNISIAFTALVAVVIIGFYFIAWKKEALAQNIFSGEKGIQFITLFLIIISIILFGIMGTLESRELSALLGALSGYILGKTTSAAREPEKPMPQEA